MDQQEQQQQQQNSITARHQHLGPLEEEQYALKIQSLVRGYLFRKDYFQEYSFKSASSKSFPQRIIVNSRDMKRLSSLVSNITMSECNSERSLFSYYEDCSDEHPGFVATKNEEQGSPIRCPRRIASQESESSYMMKISPLLTLEEDEEHPGFDNKETKSARRPLNLPRRELSVRGFKKENLNDESSLLFSPHGVDAAFGTTEMSMRHQKDVNKLKFSPLPLTRGHQALARKSAASQIIKDSAMCCPQRRTSYDSRSLLSSTS